MDFRKFLESQWASIRPNQREMPFMHEPGYYRKASNFLDQDMFSPEETKPYSGGSEFEKWNLYHVTTNLSAVKTSGRLKSCAELGGSVGLGCREGRNKVSTTHDFNRAMEIYNQLKLISELTRGLVPAHTAWDVTTGGLQDPWDFQEVRGVLKSYLPKKVYSAISDGQLPEETMDRYINTPELVYDFWQSLESAVSGAESEMERDTNEFSVIGFIGDFNSMKKINPKEIAIIQLVVRKDAQSEQIPQEKEIRFSPEDLRIIRYYQP